MEGDNGISGDEVEDEVIAELDSIFDDIHIKRVQREVNERQQLMELFRIVGSRISGNSGDGFEVDNQTGE
jgi:hypothetical protein